MIRSLVLSTAVVLFAEIAVADTASAEEKKPLPIKKIMAKAMTKKGILPNVMKGTASDAEKADALRASARCLRTAAAQILTANAKDMENVEGKQSKIDHFDRVLEIEGDLDGDQKKRLMEIADRCPVHRTLHGDIKVNTTLKE